MQLLMENCNLKKKKKEKSHNYKDMFYLGPLGGSQPVNGTLQVNSLPR